MRELLIFSGITPNSGRGHFFAFSNYAAYIAYLTANATAVGSVVYDNYRLDKNLARVRAIYVDHSEAAANASYVVEREYEGSITNITDFKAYYVQRVVSYAGFFDLFLLVDNWGTFYPLATIDDIRVSRCNRNVGHGVFDLPKSTTSNAPLFAFWHTTNNRMNLGEVSLVMKLRTIAGQNILGQDVVTTYYMVEIRLDEVVALFKNESQQWRIVNNATTIDLAARLAAGVYATATLSQLADLDAEVAQAWLIPSAQIRRSTLPPDIKLKARTPYTGSGYTIEFNVNKLDVSRTLDYVDISDLDINYKWYAGTYKNGLPISLTSIANRRLLCYYDINLDGVTITLYDGDNQKDVTDEFELPVLGASEVADGLAKISFYLGMSKDIISGLASIFQAKTAAGAAKSGFDFGVNYINSIIGNENKTQANGQSGRGNASFNYSVVFSNGWQYLNDKTQQYVYFPLVLVGFLSLADEEANAARYGISFDVTLNAMSDVFAAAFVMYGSTFTYLEADANVEGVPTEAADFIHAALLAGVKIINL